MKTVNKDEHYIDNVMKERGDLKACYALYRLGCVKDTHKKMLLAIAMLVVSAALVMVSARVLGNIIDTLASKIAGVDAHLQQLGSTDKALWFSVAVFLFAEGLSIAIQYQGRKRLAVLTNDIALRVRCCQNCTICQVFTLVSSRLAEH